jgi:hypothetical protein
MFSKGVDTVCWEDLSLREKSGKGLKVEGDGIGVAVCDSADFDMGELREQMGTDKTGGGWNRRKSSLILFMLLVIETSLI